MVTRGWNGYRNKSQHRTSTLEKKILPPFQQGFEPATFQSRVRRSNHWAIPAPQFTLEQLPTLHKCNKILHSDGSILILSVMHMASHWQNAKSLVLPKPNTELNKNPFKFEKEWLSHVLSPCSATCLLIYFHKRGINLVLNSSSYYLYLRYNSFHKSASH